MTDSPHAPIPCVRCGSASAVRGDPADALSVLCPACSPDGRITVTGVTGNSLSYEVTVSAGTTARHLLNLYGMANLLADISGRLNDEDKARVERCLSDFCRLHDYDMGRAAGGGFWIEARDA